MQNLAWIAFTRGRIVEAEARLHEAADRFAEVGDWDADHCLFPLKPVSTQVR